MKDNPDGSDEGAQEYYIVPEEALQFLPEKWRTEFQAVLDDGRAVLASADGALSNLIRLSKSFSTLASLKHVRKRLVELEFAPTLDSIMDLDMLTTAFVVTYVRLSKGEAGSGFDRGALPAHLRASHDQIVDLRNKRFAHNTDHHSMTNAMEVAFGMDRFEVSFRLSMTFQVGGADEWHDLVQFLDEMYATRIEKILARLKSETGREWSFASAP